MIRLDIEQGSPEWIKARLGIPTASCFDRILTPKTMKLSASADPYLHQCLAEWLLGVCLDDADSAFMQRGRELEDSAIARYEFERDVQVERVGLILRDDRMVGCSPDGLVGDDGGIEIKCPSAVVHVGHMLDMGVGDKHRAQVQGALWLTGRKWWDVLSYNPDLPPALVRVERDEAFIAALAGAVDSFIERLLEARQEMIRRGYKEAA